VIGRGLTPYRSHLNAFKVARQGIEPCLTVSKTVVRIHHTRKPCYFHQCPCQESNLIFDLRRVACVSTTLHRHIHSGAGGIRTHKHLLLKQAAQPLAYHTLLRETLLRFELKATCFADMSRTKRSSAVPISSPGRTRTVDRLGVNQVPSPLGHRTMYYKRSGRPGTRTPKRVNASCFQDSALIQPDVFHTNKRP
jgi:hypothetical protein